MARRGSGELGILLAKLGAKVLREVSHPTVIAVFRFAITEAQQPPEVAATLESARQSVRDAVRDITAQARSSKLIYADAPRDLDVRFLALLWDDLMVSLLLRLREAPCAAEVERRAKHAAEDFLRLYASP